MQGRDGWRQRLGPGQPQGRLDQPGGGGRDDSSSVFLSSSDEMNRGEAWADIQQSPGSGTMPSQHDVPFLLDTRAPAGAVVADASVSGVPQESGSAMVGALATGGSFHSASHSSQHRCRPRLWRVFPRCIRASMEEVCIAAEATLGVAPSECTVTAIKGNRSLPVRLDFLNDRQATGEDSDQPSRQARGPGAAAARRRAARAAQHMLRPQRPDSEVVLIWLTPGTSPGLVWIELHARGPVPDAPSADGAAQPQAASTITTMLTSLAAPPNTSTAAEAATAGAVVPGGGAGGSSGTGLGGGRAGRGVMSMSSLQNAGLGPPPGPQPHALSVPTLRSGRFAPGNSLHSQFSPSARGGGVDDVGTSGGVGSSSGTLTSGALSLVVVPDADMEAEVCSLLAQQYQQTPLPVSSSSERMTSAGPTSASSVTGAAGGGAGVIAAFGDGAAAGADPTARAALGGPGAAALASGGLASGQWLGPMDSAGAVSVREILIEGMFAEGDEDSEDAGARECFLWDLGAWLELSAAHAAERAAVAAAAVAAAQQAQSTAGMTAGTAVGAATAGGLMQAGPLAFPQYRQFQQEQELPETEQQQQPQSPGDALQQQQHAHLSAVAPDVQPVLGYAAGGALPHPTGDATLSPLLPDSFRHNPGVPAPTSHASSDPPTQPLPLAAGAPAAAPPPPPPPLLLPRSALELLGFACSRGWAATTSHIVLGLLDMGHSMAGINAAVQAAHGWSALHLAAASGSAELLAMTALWRSYGRYGDSAAVQEEWRAMLATPGPGGLTPLHLAAVLPQPATATLDLLSSLPAETLSTWFGSTAHDGCTPAHYASRAGNAHINDHALLCLATGAAALGYESAEDLPYLSEVQAEALSLVPADLESTELASSGADGSAAGVGIGGGHAGSGGGDGGSGGGDGSRGGGSSGGTVAEASPPTLPSSVGEIGGSPHLGTWPLWAGGGSYRHAANLPAVTADALAASSQWGSPSSGSGGGRIMLPPSNSALTAPPSTATDPASGSEQPPSTSDGSPPPPPSPPHERDAGPMAAPHIASDTAPVAAAAAAAAITRVANATETEAWGSAESWFPQQPQRRSWLHPSQLVAGLLDRVASPAASTHGSGGPSSPPWPAAAAPSWQGAPTRPGPGLNTPPEGRLLATAMQQSTGPQHLQRQSPLGPVPNPGLGPMTLAQAREAALRLVGAAVRAVSSAPEPAALSAAAAGGGGGSPATAAAAAGGSDRLNRSAPPAVGPRLLAGLTDTCGELLQVQSDAQQHRQLLNLRVQQQMRLMQAAPGSTQPLLPHPQPLLPQPPEHWQALVSSRQLPADYAALQVQPQAAKPEQQQEPEQHESAQLRQPVQQRMQLQSAAACAAPEPHVELAAVPSLLQSHPPLLAEFGTPGSLEARTSATECVPLSKIGELETTQHDGGGGPEPLEMASAFAVEGAVSGTAPAVSEQPGLRMETVAAVEGEAVDTAAERAAHEASEAEGGEAAAGVASGVWESVAAAAQRLIPERLRPGGALPAVAVAALAVAYAALLLPVGDGAPSRALSAHATWSCAAVLWPLVTSLSLSFGGATSPPRFSLGVILQLLGLVLHAALLASRVAADLPCCLLSPPPQPHAAAPAAGSSGGLAAEVLVDLVTALVAGLVLRWLLHKRWMGAYRQRGSGAVAT